MTVSKTLRRVVAERARSCCEYCLLDERDSYTPHQVDHIVSQKHGGTSDSQNLAWACTRCNAWKGSDVSAIDPETGEAIPLFHPRRDHGRITSNGAAIGSSHLLPWAPPLFACFGSTPTSASRSAESSIRKPEEDMGQRTPMSRIRLQQQAVTAEVKSCLSRVGQ